MYHLVFHITLPKPFKTHYFGSNTLFASLGSDPDTSRSQFPSSSAQIYVLGSAKTIFGSQSYPSFYIIFGVTFSQQLLQFVFYKIFKLYEHALGFKILYEHRTAMSCASFCVFLMLLSFTSFKKLSSVQEANLYCPKSQFISKVVSFCIIFVNNRM